VTYEKLTKLERQYKDWLAKKPFFVNTKVEMSEGKNWAIWINYKKGMTIATKKEIATELGDIPLKFNEIKE
jgi:hypothetical protein